MMTISVRRVTMVLAVGTAVLLLASSVAVFIGETTGLTRILGVLYLQLLYVGREARNFPVWYASALLLLSAVATAAVAGTRSDARRRAAGQWWLLAGFLALLSADESVRLHERIPGVVAAVTGLDVRWVGPAAVSLAVILAATRGAWGALSPRELRRFVVAGAVYLGGAVGMEVVAIAVGQAAGGVVRLVLIHVEEAMEMAGLVLLLRAVLLVLAPDGRLTVRLGAEAATPAVEAAVAQPARSLDSLSPRARARGRQRA